MEVFTTVLGIGGTVCAIVFGYIAFRRNNKNDDTAEGKKDGVLLTEIRYIKSGVDDIKRKQEKEDELHLKVVERLSAVESSAKPFYGTDAACWYTGAIVVQPSDVIYVKGATLELSNGH